ncbi:hypothetical protein PRIPAC_94882 [Pristionchus pacificus]|uniref:Uncharacterized protein n=1 Tax=Pristionchus pacificus TaxID=54126 RepID=A0A2A6BAG1_PRIPA|nr:hypothetical protein PRIPAC_94882 [Pristionchus pacificus]|eukprot:PDM62856.1 hypothetical protein PRIPAC_50071 [Pristionchus pacificus]
MQLLAKKHLAAGGSPVSVDSNVKEMIRGIVSDESDDSIISVEVVDDQNGEESENESFDKDVNNEEQKKYYFERNKIKYKSKECYVNDTIVKEGLVKIFRNLERNPRTTPYLTEFDKDAIKIRLHNMGFRVSHTNKRKDIKEYIIDGYPYTMPKNYRYLGKKEDSFGYLRFYDTTSDSKADETEIPDYEYVEKSEFVMEDTDVRILRKAKRCDFLCTCDQTVGCQIETCECMQESAMRNGVVHQGLMRGRVGIVECCAMCPCRRSLKRCPSILKFRKIEFHAVRTHMGFALRVLQPVQRGVPILNFTGERVNYIQEEAENWAYTNANCSDQATREIRVDLSATPSSPTLAGSSELLYLNYGSSFGIDKRHCLCTQELCHDRKMMEWFSKLSYRQVLHAILTIPPSSRYFCCEAAAALYFFAAFKVLKRREEQKRKRIIERQQDAILKVSLIFL